MKNKIVKIFTYSLLLSMILIGFHRVKPTLSYYHDTESSVENTWQGGVVDLSPSSNTVDISIENKWGEGGEGGNGSITWLNAGTLDLIFTHSMQSSSCDKTSVTYSPDGHILVGKSAAGSFTATYNGGDEGESCQVVFLFEAEQLNQNPSGTFTNYEEITVNINVGAAQEPASSGGIVINEVFYDVDQGHGEEGKNEWVELYNGTDSPQSLKDWKLVSMNGEEKINRNYTLEPGEFVVISHDSQTCASLWSCDTTSHINLGGNLDEWLKNDGDYLFLKDDGGNEIDFVAWEEGGEYAGWTIEAEEGKSISRDPNGEDTDSINDWVVLDNPTPGE